MRSKGFTIIELMIVVSIIGILAAIAIPNFLKHQQRAAGVNGVKKPISEPQLVEVLNPSGIQGPLGEFHAGSHCHTLRGDIVQGVGKDDHKVLVRYLASSAPESGSCPDGVLFFLDLDEFWDLDDESASPEDDSDIVKRLLEEDAKNR